MVTYDRCHNNDVRRFGCYATTAPISLYIGWEAPVRICDTTEALNYYPIGQQIAPGVNSSCEVPSGSAIC